MGEEGPPYDPGSEFYSERVSESSARKTNGMEEKGENKKVPKKLYVCTIST